MNENSQDGTPVAARRPRVLIIDDSAPSRAVLAEALEAGGCDVVGRAMDGAIALRLAFELEPDVITCDLAMPNMDGFTFLRILSKTRATPVIVVSSNSTPEAALMALELGARDFVVKPGRATELRKLGDQIVARVHALANQGARPLPMWTPPADIILPPHIGLVVLGCSTGGPRALRDIFARVRTPPRIPVVIAQHMPAGFTETFALRLGRHTGLDIAEARDGEQMKAGMIRIAPGGRHARILPDLKLAIVEEPLDRWSPSVDMLLESAATALGARALGVVLTGMGRDGVEGARALRRAGAPLWTESSMTAAIEGMPSSAARAHGAAERLPLDALAEHLARLLARPTGSP